ncbi:hypothetical protein MCHI_000470 [Candidatus Magnetoovum chiemensis]|nr:hypothetical protein MCHI_000470 [Candidatus Magnetoovum chiemensis]
MQLAAIKDIISKNQRYTIFSNKIFCKYKCLCNTIRIRLFHV